MVLKLSVSIKEEDYDWIVQRDIRLSAYLRAKVAEDRRRFVSAVPMHYL